MKRIAILLVHLLFASALAYGQAGYLDKTFGDGGVVKIELVKKSIVPKDIKTTPEGKILHCGWMDGDIGLNTYLYVMMHNEDGSIYPSFGKYGLSTFSEVSSVDNMQILLYKDGRILMYGDMSQKSEAESLPFIIRFLSDGKIDSSFGNNGLYFDNTFTYGSYFHKVTIGDDESLIAVGLGNVSGDSVSGRNLMITKITSGGQRDISFGDQGVVVMKSVKDTNEEVADVVFTHNGYIITALSVPDASQTGIHLIKCDLNGILDSTFGQNGAVQMRLSDASDDIQSIVETPEGDIVCLVQLFHPHKVHYYLARFDHNGSIDESFGDFGVAGPIDSSQDNYYYFCTLDSSSNIIIAGSAHKQGVGIVFTTIRYSGSGQKDSSYGQFGISYESPERLDYGGQIAIQKDGKYVAFEYYHFTYNICAIFRIDNTSTSSVSRKILSTSCISLHPTPSTDNCSASYTLASSGECTMTLRDENGRQVRTFATNEYRTAGEHKEELDLRGLAAGVYFLQIESGGTIQTAKLIKQ